MAILYSKNRKAAEQPAKGFDLVFTDGTTYNLDDFVKYKDRSNTDAELMLRVIDDKELSEKILSEIMSMFRTTISDVISNETVQKKVSEIIADVASRYGLTTLEEVPPQVYTILNREVNEYLKSLFDTYGINYEVRFFDATRADIRYSFSDTESMKQLVQERLNFYLTKYKNEIVDVEEGSLNLTNVGKRRTVGAEDYKKYLLGEEFGKEKSTQGYVPNVTGRRPVIMWEDGSQDNTNDGEEAIDIYEELERMNEKLSSIGSTETLGKFETEDVYVGEDTGMENNVAQVEGFSVIDQQVMFLDD